MQLSETEVCQNAAVWDTDVKEKKKSFTGSVLEPAGSVPEPTGSIPGSTESASEANEST